jgi:hypothetical protein
VKTKLNRLLLYTQTEADYEILLREIKQEKLSYHTYPLPQTQQPRLALKGLPPNVAIDEIRDDLNLRNLQVAHIRQIIRMDNPTERLLQKFPIFVVTFQAGTDLRDVYKTKKICHCIVRWEKFKAKRPIPQCFNCQQFGHSSTYCGRPSKCVKCNKSHSTQDCKNYLPTLRVVQIAGVNTPQISQGVLSIKNGWLPGLVNQLRNTVLPLPHLPHGLICHP